MTKAIAILNNMPPSDPVKHNVKKSDTGMFKSRLHEAVQSDKVGYTKPDNKTIIKKLEQVIETIDKGLSENTLPADAKKVFQNLLKLLKTIKEDLNSSAPDASTLEQLFQSLQDASDMIQSTDLIQPSDIGMDHGLKQLLEDFKKRFGSDNPVAFISAILQPIASSLGLDVPSGDHAVEKTAGNGQMNSKIPTDNTLISTANSGDGQKVDSKTGSTQSFLNNGTESDHASQNNLRQTVNTKSDETQWISGGPMNKIQQLIFHSEGKPQSAGAQILDQVRSILAQGNIKPLPNGGLQLTIQLKPESLGTVQVVLTQTDAGLQATITAQNQATKELLQSQLSQLKQSFTAMGVQVQKMDVAQFSQVQQDPSQYNGQAYQQPERDGRNKERRPQRDHLELSADLNGDSLSFDDWLNEGRMWM
ncbi:MAG: flagellar hook-length control protein FliK [Tuberibacillus sp.]